MAVFRVEKTKDYTVMANHHLRNIALSLKAKGLLSLMLSLPENFELNKEWPLEMMEHFNNYFYYRDLNGWKR